MNANKVLWNRLGKEEFDKAVELLLFRRFQSNQSVELRVIDGRGGDDGIDIDVSDVTTGELIHVFQLKYFPEGMFGGWKATRRKQVLRSLVSAGKLKPRKWTLVLPCEGTLAERKWLTTTAQSMGLSASFAGRTELNSWLVDDPDAEAWIQKDQTLIALGALGRESFALGAPGDFSAEGRRLHQRASARSAYWSPVLTVGPLGTTEELVAIHPEAAAREPLGLKLDLDFGTEDSDLSEELESLLKFGGPDPVHLPGQVVKNLERTGPGWFQGSESPELLTISPIPHQAAFKRITMSSVTNARVTQKMTSTSIQRFSGSGGAVVHVKFNDALKMTVRISIDSTASVATKFEIEPLNQEARVVHESLRFLESMSQAEVVVFNFDGRKFEVAPASISPVQIDSRMKALISDLAFLEEALDITLPVPEDLPTATEVAWLRTLRLLLEDKLVVAPRASQVTFTLDGGIDEWLTSALLSTDGFPFSFEVPDFEIKLFGVDIPVGTVSVHHRCLVFEDGPALYERLVDGSAAGLGGRLKPNDASPFLMSTNELSTYQEVSPWAFPGLNEHPSIQMAGLPVAADPGEATSDVRK